MKQVLIQFEDKEFSPISETMQVPISIEKRHLLKLINQEVDLFIDGKEIISGIENLIEKYSDEDIIKITCSPEEKTSKPSLFCSSAYSGHEAPVLCVKAVKNIVVSGGGDCTLRIWDPITKTQKKILKNDTHWVMSVDADENLIVSGSMDGKIKVYDHSGKLLRSLNGHKNTITQVKIQKNLIISSSRDRGVRVWKDSITLFSYQHDHSVNGFVYENDTLYSFGRDGKVRVFRNKEESFEFVKEIQHDSSVNTLDVRGPYLLSGCENGSVYLYKNFKRLFKVSHSSTVTSVQIAENELSFVSSSFDKRVRLCSIKDGKEIFSYLHSNFVYKARITNNLIISSSKDRSIKIYDYKKKRLVSELVCKDEIYCFDETEGKIVAGCKDRLVYFFE